MRLPATIIAFLTRFSLACLLALCGVAAANAQASAAPLIQWFVPAPSSIAAGTSTTLRWSVDGADSVRIDPGVGAVQSAGSMTVSPSATTTYTLTASNASGTVRKSQVVVVSANATESGLRWVKMVGPSSGQKFTAPATLRVFAAAFDPTGANCGVDGTEDRCASRVDFYVDDTLMGTVQGNQSEFWVFKSSFGGIGAGTHRVWARAIYVNPAETLDSEPSWITVEDAPAYAQTIDLAADVVLSGAQDYEVMGTAAGRIRLNGHGHHITSDPGWNGRLTLKNVDLFDFGAPGDTTPSIDVTSGNGVVIEDSVFDTTGIVSLVLTGSATASVRRNEFRENMRMPEAQLPEFGDDSSYPAFQATGGSSAAKFFQGNRIGIGWADFRNGDNWLIGGAEGEGNVVIAPRGGIWAQNMTRTVIRGNFIYHVYFGGWSQGNVMEANGSHDLLVEHNVIGGGSWPIRGLGGTLRYNIVLDAGHQWLWLDEDDSAVHHNIFTGGDAEIAGIWTIGQPQGVEFYNNTIDGIGMDAIRPFQVGEGSSALLHSNAFVNAANAPAIEVGGTLVADNNLFSGQQGTPRNYSDNRAPAHDVGGLNAQVDPRFVEPSEPWRYGRDDVWTRRVTVSQILAKYRARYTPAPGSPLIDAGEQTFVAGNDIGAVGAGQPAADDLFGFANTVPPTDATAPSGTIAIDGGAATTDQANVTLTLAATDDASGVTQMRFANESGAFGFAMPFAPTAAWTLSSGNGTKTVSVEFRDGAGNWSDPVSATIVLDAPPPVDATPPMGTVSIDGGAASTNDVNATLTLTASDDASGVPKMRFSDDGVTFDAPVPFATTASRTLPAGDGTKTVFVQFQDGAGNWSVSFSDTIELSTTTTPPPPPGTGPILALGFDEGQGTTVRDASGHGLSGTLGDATWAAGRFGSALRFTGGLGSVVTVSDSPLLRLTGAFTLSAWVNPAAALQPEPAVIAKENGIDTLPFVMYAQQPGGLGPTAFAFTNGAYHDAKAPAQIPANAWTYLTATYDGATLSVYVNGVLAASTAVSGGMPAAAGPLRIGNDAVFPSEGFAGLIDEVRVYDRALAPAEIARDMATPIGGLVAAYGFEEGAGASAADSSGDALTGVVTGATWVEGKFGKALQFAGAQGSWVTVADADALDLTTGMTISAWVKPTADLVQWPAVIMKERPDELTYALYANSKDGNVNVDYTSGGAEVNLEGAGSIPVGEWSHLAGTFDGTTMRLYVNGALVSSTPATGPIDVTDGVLRIGGDNVWQGEYFTGAIDEVRIYNRALSEAEVQLDMNAPVVFGTRAGDSTPPAVAIGSPASGSAVSGTQAISVNASDDVGVTRVRVLVDGAQVGGDLTAAPYTVAWDTTTATNGSHVLTATADDAAGHSTTSAPVAVNVSNVAGGDTTPPTGTIAIDGGAASTGQAAVTLSLAATDDASGVVQMRFSNDGVEYSDPVAFASAAPWALAAGDGTKTVFAQFRDGAGNWSAAASDTIELVSGPAESPQLGAFKLVTQNDGAGSAPAVTQPIDTQPAGSTLIAFSMGWLGNLADPVDSFGNTWTKVSGPNVYAGPEFYTAVWAVPSAIGGSAHTVSFDKVDRPAGEISAGLIEVKHGGTVDLVYREADESDPTPGSITVDGPATLIAIWSGESFALDHTAVPDNGFTVIDSYLDFGSGTETGVQVAVAVREVAQAGTYTVHWTTTPEQRCACYLVAVRNSQQAPANPGLVAAYGFDEGLGATAADASGHALSGVVTNAAWAAGRFGNALQFNGAADSRVTVADSPLLQLANAFTLSAWVNPAAALTQEPAVVAKENGTVTLPYVMYAQNAASGPTAFAFTNGDYHDATVPTQLPPNTWTHLAATYDGATLSMYVNGVLAKQSAVSGAMPVGAGALRIGNDAVFPGEGFNGLIDEVRVYDRALSPAEIQADMQAPVGAGSPPPPDDTTPPTVAVDAPAAGSTVSGTTTISASASDDVGVTSVRVLVDGVQVGADLDTAPYSVAWDTHAASEGTHLVTAVARDAAGHSSTSAAVTVTVANVITPPSGGLVAAYGFEEGAGTIAADASGGSLAGAVSGATWVDGKFGKALRFAGAQGSWVTVPDAAALDLSTGMTISAWVKPTAPLPEWPAVIMKERPGELTYALYANSKDGNINVDYTSGGSEQNLEGAGAVPVNQWTHVAGTYDGTTLSLYVNGQLVSSKPAPGPIDATDGVLRIGGDDVWQGEYFPGVVDEVRIYSRALSPSEIQADMAAPVVAGTQPPQPGVDTTPPSGTIAIDGGDVSTEILDVTLSLTASDDAGDVVQMRFSDDGASWSDAVPFAPSAPWTLPAGDGTKTVFAQFRDAAGNWSDAVSDSISFVTPVPLPPVPAGHPRILGAELQRLQADLAAGRPAIVRFKEQFVDAELDGADFFGYEDWHAALLGVVTGEPRYCAAAVQGVDAFLDEEIELMNEGKFPVAASDNYLPLGDVMANVALVYDWCYASLSDTQKLRWGNYADRFIDDVWNQDTNHWGPATPDNGYSWDGVPREPGTSWAVDNPLNNYYYSFLRATMLWGLVSKGEPGRAMADGFLTKFRSEKIQRQLVPIFEQQLQGGGSREGTGYGTSMGDLFGLYWFWEKTTGERIADLTSHTRSSMAYLIHALSPSRDFLAPIGDHARDSSAAFYDYHRKYLLALASLYPRDPMARTVRDFLAGSSVPRMRDGFNFVYDVLYDGDETVAPAQLDTAYYPPGTGHFFSRSGWNADATWLTFITGPYTESHAHQDGLSILLFKNGWLVGDANTLSHSGLEATQQAHGLVTQTAPGESDPIEMTGLPADPGADPPRPENSAHLRALAVRPAYTYASSDQGNLFVSPWDGDAGVREEREIVQVMPDVVVVFDRADCTCGTTTKRFQLPTAGQPTVSGRTATYSNGVSTLTVHAVQPAASTLSVTHMTDLNDPVNPDFDDGYRIDSTITTSGPTRFLDVLSVDGAVTSVTPGSDEGSVTLTLADGRTVALSFNLDIPGGTIEIRDAANQVLVSEPLPATVTPPPLLAP
jgi:hypothetical protein